MENQKKLQQYDNLFLSILQNEKSIERFMDSVFSFLSRKTDFYCVMKEKSQTYGFPKGRALQLAIKAYKKYEEINPVNVAHEQAVKKEAVKKPIASKSPTSTATSSPAPSAAAAASVIAPAPVAAAAPAAAAQAAVVSDPNASVSITDPKELTQEDFQSNPDSYNGAIRKNYSWTQSHDELDVFLNVPKYIKRAKQVSVDITRKHITVKIPAG